MKSHIRLLPFMASLPLALSSPSPKPEYHSYNCSGASAALPPAFILAGDSTTAIQIAVNGGGWGNGFLSFLRNGAWGINKGHNGATTVSYVAGGDWTNVTAYVVQKKAAGFDPYVTISFGHNDQVCNFSFSIPFGRVKAKFASVNSRERKREGETRRWRALMDWVMI
jgi:lysophospholipase L1-like esterase